MNDAVKKSGKSNTSFDLTRVIPLAFADSEKWSSAASRLLTIEPVHVADIDPIGRLHISYDASFIGVRDIESLLDELGITRKNDFWWRMKSSWYSYVDENAKANACSIGGACCNSPPSFNSGSGKSIKIS